MMRSRTWLKRPPSVSGFLRVLSLLLCCIGAQVANAQIATPQTATPQTHIPSAHRPAAPLRFKAFEPKPGLHPDVHPDATVTIELDLCVVGGTNPDLCPPDPTTDDTYVPSITYTYGQLLDGVVRASATSGTITIYDDQVLFCTLQIGITTACPAASTIFDSGSYTIVARWWGRWIRPNSIDGYRRPSLWSRCDKLHIVDNEHNKSYPNRNDFRLCTSTNGDGYIFRDE